MLPDTVLYFNKIQPFSISHYYQMVILFHYRSSPSKLDYTPVSAPELNFANISGDKLTVAQELLVPRNAARRTEEHGPGPGKSLVHTSSFRRAKVSEYDRVFSLFTFVFALLSHQNIFLFCWVSDP